LAFQNEHLLSRLHHDLFLTSDRSCVMNSGITFMIQRL